MREAVAILQAAPPDDESAVDAAYREARTRALLLKDSDLRLSLTQQLDSDYRRLKAPFEAAREEEAEEARRQRELEHAERLAAIKLEEQRRAQELAKARREEESRAQRAAQMRNTATLDARLVEGIAAIDVRIRGSLLDDGTKVLVLTNERPFSVDLNLKCFTRNGASKILFVSVPARGEKEIGFLEGWPGNFVTGERCEALHDGDTIWTVRIP